MDESIVIDGVKKLLEKAFDDFRTIFNARLEAVERILQENIIDAALECDFEKRLYENKEKYGPDLDVISKKLVFQDSYDPITEWTENETPEEEIKAKIEAWKARIAESDAPPEEKEEALEAVRQVEIAVADDQPTEALEKAAEEEVAAVDEEEVKGFCIGGRVARTDNTQKVSRPTKDTNVSSPPANIKKGEQEVPKRPGNGDSNKIKGAH